MAIPRNRIQDVFVVILKYFESLINLFWYFVIESSKYINVVSKRDSEMNKKRGVLFLCEFGEVSMPHYHRVARSWITKPSQEKTHQDHQSGFFFFGSVFHRWFTFITKPSSPLFHPLLAFSSHFCGLRSLRRIYGILVRQKHYYLQRLIT